MCFGLFVSDGLDSLFQHLREECFDFPHLIIPDLICIQCLHVDVVDIPFVQSFVVGEQ